MIIGTSIAALYYILGTPSLERAYPSAPISLFYTLAILDIFNIICAIALFYWKKWGFWGFCVTSVVGLVLNIVLGLGIWAILSSVISIAIMFAILQIGKENKGWPQLE